MTARSRLESELDGDQAAHPVAKLGNEYGEGYRVQNFMARASELQAILDLEFATSGDDRWPCELLFVGEKNGDHGALLLSGPT